MSGLFVFLLLLAQLSNPLRTTTDSRLVSVVLLTHARIVTPLEIYEEIGLCPLGRALTLPDTRTFAPHT